MPDPVADLVEFGRALRRAGLPIGLDQLDALASALPLVSIVERRALYLAMRATLVTRHEDLPIFDEQFATWFGGPAASRPQKVPLAPRHDRSFVKTALGSYMAERAAASDPEVTVPDSVRAASPLEQLQRKDFAACTDAEREAIARALRGLRLELTRRRSLRLVPARRGRQIDLAAAVRGVARHGAIAVVPRRAHKWKRRPLVVLADISGSMERYSRLVLQFLHALSRQHPTEVFVFGTRLTRITPQLALRDLDAALDRAAIEIVDYAGGTRIGECLHAFERDHARRVVRRGAVVLVISDGLDTGDPELLAGEVRRLHDRSHRLVWLNPLLGAPGYRPLAAGMAAALPFVDDFLPVRDLQSLDTLAHHLAAIPHRRGHQGVRAR
ncbi:MAG TPA: VWA domain-containing protein [Kofleriaceae bacterium]|jgi:hypothetical protein